MKIDLLVKNGYVIDPGNKMKGKFDIAIDNGKILGIYQPNTFSEYSTENVLDVSDCIVVPGLIDLHVHVFPIKTVLGISADHVGVNKGVTTVVDAGSTGVSCINFFIDEVVKKNITRVLLWINVASPGLCEGLSELADLKNIELEKLEEVIKEHGQVIHGIKVRMSSSVVKNNGIKPLEIAKKIAQKVKLPLMVHIGNPPPDLNDILSLLEAGDVVTHAFHGKKGGILDEDGKLILEAENALKRGVLFDVGHGTSSFSFKVMKRARDLGIVPHTISTDIYLDNITGPVYSLVTTMTKFIALGYSLEEVIKATTSMPAKVLRMEHEIGGIKEGNIADISILKWNQSPIKLVDSEGEEIVAEKFLLPLYTIKSGKVLKCNG
ncbi:amidohydrolase/deacetylase family metallohydrolase [Thermoanaerobacter sp. A7A]|uniref:amidohydrolase/deacetylase family metallohydrolase n=1 Tax=Thermoanaerobacter sp. A7A TaxID=1350366 RepID=UPI0003F9EBCD|nr:amidohydrolase/deacetylase family metallohydrolase [Thermoanaerobacter sp. A7A]